nr:ATP-dependent helicase [Methylomarinum sp. Ch1-1]MDP4523170.1 ATP-dependent helicase [Methylomarinum sp. Ch1-1]
MANEIVGQVKAAIDQGVPPREIAVLYRTNKMADFLQNYMFEAQIPYTIRKGNELIEATESQLMIAAARLSLNPRDQGAFVRLAEIIPGLGKKRIDKMFDSLQEGESIFDKLEELTGKAKAATDEVMAGLKELYQKGPRCLLEWTESEGFERFLEKKAEQAIKNAKSDSITDTVESRVSGYKRNLASIQKTIDYRLKNQPSNTPVDLLWANSLDVILAPPEEEYERNRVTLCTIHAAKGLEWDRVHFAGFVDGLVPLCPTAPDAPPIKPEQLNEERCATYVAITRAKTQCFIYAPKRLKLNNGQGEQIYQVSRFFAETGLTDNPEHIWHEEPVKKTGFGRPKPASNQSLRKGFGGRAKQLKEQYQSAGKQSI